MGAVPDLPPTYQTVLIGGLAFAVVTAVASAFVRTPYGRFGSRRFGPSLPIRVGWLLMEAPAPLVFALVFARGPHAAEAVPLLFAAVWAIHYGNRALLFPLLMKARPDSVMAATVVVSGMAVCAVHAWLYATWVADIGGLDASWLRDPRFLLGLPLWALGFGLIVHTEALLRRPGYSIPRGGGFRWVSSPHYLGELLAWAGLALATGCPGGLFVLAVSAANLIPRAAATQSWYRQRFPDYPQDRRALVPGLW
jgi:3-oxo-5-alpha-steroid 4-dehydrogenase 1